MLNSWRTPKGRIGFGLLATATLVALTLLVESAMAPILPALFVPIWLPLLGGEHLAKARAPQMRWALAGALLVGLFVMALVLFLAVQTGDS